MEHLTGPQSDDNYGRAVAAVLALEPSPDDVKAVRERILEGDSVVRSRRHPPQDQADDGTLRYIDAINTVLTRLAADSQS